MPVWMFEWALLATKILLDGLINGVFSIVSSFTLWSAFFVFFFGGRIRERAREREREREREVADVVWYAGREACS